jgi:pimeloyl-ACP methyl ester carboxylesterase
VIPETHYATTADGVSIAYQVTGTGPPDIVLSNASYTSNVDLQWEWPVSATLLRGLAERGRLLLFDRRGTGLSDSVSADHLPSLEARMDRHPRRDGCIGLRPGHRCRLRGRGGSQLPVRRYLP